MTILEHLADDLSACADRLAARRQTRRRRLRLAAGAGVGALALGSAGAAATSFWQPQVGDDRRGHPTLTDAPPLATQLDHLGALRRAQTDADRGLQTRYVLRFLGPEVQGVRTNLIRRVGTDSSGRALLLVPVEQSPAGPDAVCLFEQDNEGAGGSCWTTDEILAGRAFTLTIGPAGRQFSGIVPDGVATVELSDASETVRTAVNDNVYLSPYSSIGRPLIRWLNADGRTIKQIDAP